MGLGPHFYFWGVWTPTFLSKYRKFSNTISIGSSDKVNRLMKNTLQNFGSILSILFLTYCNLAVNLTGFRDCLAEYTVHSLSPCYGLLTAFVSLNSAARWCNAAQCFTKMVSFYMLVCMGVGRNFPGGALVDFY